MNISRSAKHASAIVAVIRKLTYGAWQPNTSGLDAVRLGEQKARGMFDGRVPATDATSHFYNAIIEVLRSTQSFTGQKVQAEPPEVEGLAVGEQPLPKLPQSVLAGLLRGVSVHEYDQQVAGHLTGLGEYGGVLSSEYAVEYGHQVVAVAAADALPDILQVLFE